MMKRARTETVPLRDALGAIYAGDANAMRTRAMFRPGKTWFRVSTSLTEPPCTSSGPFWLEVVAYDRKRYNPAMAWQERISVNPAVRSGKPCIKGTRITVYDVLEYLAGGMTEDGILTDFPDLTRDDIRAALGFAAARERRVANSVA
jgi:uncharacterized protein (DUF433 family)